jgi:hypothetical protein
MLSRYLVVVAVLGPLCFSVAGCGGDWSPEAVAESKRRGDVIVGALLAYHGDKGAYPAQLNGLVPQYLPSIDSPLAGDRKWKYGVYSNGQVFNLSFEGSGSLDPWCMYNSEGPKKWEFHGSEWGPS